MSFVVVESQRVWWPVIVRGVNDEGQPVEQEFQMHFILLDEEENAKVAEDLEKKLNALPMSKATEVVAKAVKHFADDWKGVELQGANGEKTSLPFSDDNLLILLRTPNVREGIMNAYRACRRAEPELRLGN